eukprot:SAG11_NODE_37_length_21777_cov_4.523711_6_plen_235_part_00
MYVALAFGAGTHELSGYVVYTLSPLQMGDAEAAASADLVRPQHLLVRELIWLDSDAYRSLWSWLGRHDLVGSIEWDNVPPDDPAPLLWLEPRLLRPRQAEGMFVRIVDFEAALKLRGWSGGAGATDGANVDSAEAGHALTIFVQEDELAAWNSGGWSLELTSDGPRVSRLPPTVAATECEIILDIGTLSALYMGRASATQLARAGLLRARDAGLLCVVDAMFLTQHSPHCADHF